MADYVTALNIAGVKTGGSYSQGTLHRIAEMIQFTPVEFYDHAYF
jgi:hypothetical protein